MPATWFATSADFRVWLDRYHATTPALLVGFRKRGGTDPCMTWSEAVDEALCYGWIDGVRRMVDARRYTIRFTPRRTGSTWSAVNIARIATLQAKGTMTLAGLRAFARRSVAKSRTYSYERTKLPRLEPELQRRLAADRAASRFHDAQAPSYRAKVVHWIMSAKSKDTRLARLRRVLAAYGDGRRL